ncbi:histidine-rich protein PFHRP-II [Drosophila virilis]|uniref:histidine-rich protein PFHRP-II n=1 Tax=Drosophila virilis TaxID=7244 RepID=UPI00139634B1|nr:histidine-rich glycoprotein [Drosophila virilis]
MKFFICTLALLGVAQAGLLSHLEHDHHHEELPHLVDSEVHHSNGIHLGHSSAIVIDGADHHLDAVPHPVYHHDGYSAHLDHDVHAHDHVHHAHVHAPAKIVSHEPIHEVEPVHHVHKVVHDEPHHFLHYRNPVVDHHIIHNTHAHIDEHAHAHADLHHYAHHSAPLVHHHHSAPLVHHHHTHAAVVHKAAFPAHLDVHSHANLLSFAKHHLHGKYGKVRITETHY